MKELVCLLAVFAAVAGSAAPAFAITQDQALAGGVLNELKLERQPSAVIGGPQKYQITKKTIEHLQGLMKAGKVIVVKGDESIEIVDDKQPASGDKAPSKTAK